MDSDSADEFESSLPTQTVRTIRSSPPVLTRDSSFPKMDKHPALKSDPPVIQGGEASRPSLKRVSSDETERPPSAQQLHGDSDEQTDANDEEELEEDTDPSDRIVDFDWEDLHQRYHEAVDKCQGEEAELMQEWESLMTYFRVWAESGQEHETGRTYSRLRTRMTYVQNSEDKLEKTRNHYINVVRAFESALNLLKANGLGR